MIGRRGIGGAGGSQAFAKCRSPYGMRMRIFAKLPVGRIFECRLPSCHWFLARRRFLPPRILTVVVNLP